MNEFEVNILAADRPFYQGPCVHLQVPISTGQYGILAHHRNVIAAIVPGKLRLRTPDGAEQTAAVSRGFLKVENNHVLLLADTIERPEEIDANRARREAEAVFQGGRSFSAAGCGSEFGILTPVMKESQFREKYDFLGDSVLGRIRLLG